MLSENSPVPAIVAQVEKTYPAWLGTLKKAVSVVLDEIAKKEEALELDRKKVGKLILDAAKNPAVVAAVQLINFPNGPKGPKKVGRPLAEYSYVAGQLAEHFGLDKETLERYARLNLEEEKPEEERQTPGGRSASVRPPSPAKLAGILGNELEDVFKRYLVREVGDNKFAPILKSAKEQHELAKELEERVEQAFETLGLNHWRFIIGPKAK